MLADDRELAFADDHRFAQHRHGLRGELLRLHQRGDTGAHQHELVSADASDHVSGAQSGPQPIRDDPQGLVADRAANGVIDQLEVIESDARDRDT